MSNFDQWAAPSSKDKAAASLYDSGGFDDEPPPPSSNNNNNKTSPSGSNSFISSQMNSRAPVLETKNSHLLSLSGPQTWQSDSEALTCNTCMIPFDFFLRRHHCRRCGLIFCDECTSARAMMPLSWGDKDPQRVCSDCNFALMPIQAELSETNANCMRDNEVDDSSLWRYVNRPVNFSLGGDVRKAAYTIQNLIDGVETYIEDDKYRSKNIVEAEALLFITTAKVAFIGGIRFGTGLLINKLPGTEVGWSAPCAVGSLGISFGIMAGLEVTDIIVPLRTADAINHFKKSFGLTLGGEAGFALGPIGRQGAAEAMGSTAGVNASMSLSNSRGIYGGLTLDGCVVKVRNDINIKFYGKDYSVDDLMDGTVPPPPAAKPLYDKLAEYKQVVLSRNFGNKDARTARMDDAAGDYPGNNNSNQQQQQQQQQQQSVPNQAVSGAYNAYNSATPEQRQQAYGAAQNVYNRATPEQRQQAFKAVSSAAADDVFV
jgi:lipid-binding SYLF domain-containing protein